LTYYADAVLLPDAIVFLVHPVAFSWRYSVHLLLTSTMSSR
jgi:hypothetical protein